MVSLRLCQGFHRWTAQGEYLRSLRRSGEAPWHWWFVPRFANAKCVACRGLVRGGRWPRILRMGWPAGNLLHHGDVYKYMQQTCGITQRSQLIDRLFRDRFFHLVWPKSPSKRTMDLDIVPSALAGESQAEKRWTRLQPNTERLDHEPRRPSFPLPDGQVAALRIAYFFVLIHPCIVVLKLPNHTSVWSPILDWNCSTWLVPSSLASWSLGMSRTHSSDSPGENAKVRPNYMHVSRGIRAQGIREFPRCITIWPAELILWNPHELFIAVQACHWCTHHWSHKLVQTRPNTCQLNRFYVFYIFVNSFFVEWSHFDSFSWMILVFVEWSCSIASYFS